MSESMQQSSEPTQSTSSSSGSPTLFQKMTQMCESYLDKIVSSVDGTDLDDELETRFKNISKIDHDNVVKKLLALGFHREPITTSMNILINDNYRIPISGEQNVYRYCNTSQLTSKAYQDIEKKIRVDRLDFLKEKEFPFNFTLSTEQKVSKSEQTNIESRFAEMPKIYRYIRRLSFTHDDYPYLVIDLSTVKQSTRGQSFIHSLSNSETYEIEIEFKKDRNYYFKGTDKLGKELKLTEGNIKKKVITTFKKYIKYVLSGIQE